MEKRSWLWWLSGREKDVQDDQDNKVRHQTDQGAKRQTNEREYADRVKVRSPDPDKKSPT